MQEPLFRRGKRHSLQAKQATSLTQAVNTFHLVLADDDPTEGGSLFKEEDSVSLASLAGAASTRAAVVAGVGLWWSKSLASLDADGCAQGARLGRAREDVGSSAALDAGNL